MIQQETRLKVTDDAGAKELLLHPCYGWFYQKICKCRNIIVASVKDATPGGVVKKGDVVEAVVVRTVNGARSKDRFLYEFSMRMLL